MAQTAEMQKKLRNYIKEWRKYRGLTQGQVAERIERDVSVVSRTERGEIKIGQEVLERMAFALGCDDPIDLLFPPPNHPEAEVIDLVRRLKGPRQRQALRLLKAMLEEEVA
jgi:transcriptional regulator with XRE-family HTH domain